MIPARVRARVIVVILAFVAGLLFAALEQAAAGDIPTDPRQAHAYADAVLRPRFEAAYNEYRYRHPQDRERGLEWEHTHKNDKGDTERWQLVVSTFMDYQRAMKTAGFNEK